MKIRSGFVSNSSSTSYVILVPNGFDVDDFVYSNLDALRKRYAEDNRREYPRPKKGETGPKVILPYDYIENFIKRFKGYVKSGSLYGDNDRYSYGDLYLISDMMKSLIIANVEGGPDQGTLTFVKQDKIINIFNKYEANDIGEEEKSQLRSKIKVEREEYERIKKDTETKMKGIDPYGEENWWEK
jgi:hypothetical protein